MRGVKYFSTRTLVLTSMVVVEGYKVTQEHFFLFIRCGIFDCFHNDEKDSEQEMLLITSLPQYFMRNIS